MGTGETCTQPRGVQKRTARAQTGRVRECACLCVLSVESMSGRYPCKACIFILYNDATCQNGSILFWNGKRSRTPQTVPEQYHSGTPRTVLERYCSRTVRRFWHNRSGTVGGVPERHRSRTVCMCSGTGGGYLRSSDEHHAECAAREPAVLAWKTATARHTAAWRLLQDT